MNERIPDESHQSERLNGVLLEFLEKVDAGHSPDRELLLAENPELREDLSAFFDIGDDLHRLSGALKLITGRDSDSGVSDSWKAVSGFESTPDRPPDNRSTGRRLGDFRLLRVIGRGGMGIVYEAEQCSIKRRVALKVLPYAAAIDARQLQRFRNESAAASHLQHPNIVPVLSVGDEGAIHYFAMQYVDGLSLNALVKILRSLSDVPWRPKSRSAAAAEAHGAPGGGTVSEKQTGIQEKQSSRTPVERILESVTARRRARGMIWAKWVAAIGRDVALALEYAHRTGVVHRDVKPGNLLLDGDGRIWVTDFGLAQFGTDPGLTMTGEVLGTLRYASPEQIQTRRGIVDHRSDIYSLGATLYELLTLQPVVVGSDRAELLHQIADVLPAQPRSVDPSIPADLENIIRKSLNKDAADRYATADDLAADLQRFIDNQPVVAQPPSIVQNLRHWARRHPSVIAAGSAVLIVLWIGFGVGMALLQAEHARTQSARQDAEAAYARERYRAEEAEYRFLMARRSVDALIEASEEELASRPGMELVRMRLLATALQYYEELIEQRRDNEDRTELEETRLRVQMILEDLAVLRVASRLHLLDQQVVLDDLQLSETQRDQIRDVLARMRRQWMQSFSAFGNQSVEKRSQRAVEHARGNDADVQKILTPSQQARFHQIGLRWDGVAAFRDPEVASALGLTTNQCRSIRHIEESIMLNWIGRRRQSGRSGESENDESDESEKTPTAVDKVLALLTDKQRQQWEQMIGEPVPGLTSRRFSGARSSGSRSSSSSSGKESADDGAVE